MLFGLELYIIFHFFIPELELGPENQLLILLLLVLHNDIQFLLPELNLLVFKLSLCFVLLGLDSSFVESTNLFCLVLDLPL